MAKIQDLTNYIQKMLTTHCKALIVNFYDAKFKSITTPITPEGYFEANKSLMFLDIQEFAQNFRDILEEEKAGIAEQEMGMLMLLNKPPFIFLKDEIYQNEIIPFIFHRRIDFFRQISEIHDEMYLQLQAISRDFYLQNKNPDHEEEALN